ncbi:nuclear factor 7, ovary-like [Hippocampus comes]|uniref:nuclear factor 7, ovary-like n=1 Tax=Hippocampus comes TaxID=109280 RepID=UPI00094EEC06|nr:PREDICTED: nuclear factor 7, ovary-like [Hippocampus comes]
MASASFTDDLTCSICLTIFTDPVTLLCGHSFCRKCLICFWDTQHQCPQCRASLADACTSEDLCTNFVLLSLAEKAKQTDVIDKEHITAKAEVADMCPEHDEKLKLYCVTDQQLTCIICRDGERHEGHTFKPIKEASASLKRELEKGLDRIPGDIKTLERLLNTQRENINATQDRSCQLGSQISAQFEELHQFLRKREEELKNEVTRQQNVDVEQMTKMLNAIEAELSQSRALQAKAVSVLAISDPETFLKGWAKGNNVMLQGASRPKASDLSVVETSLSLGPYESHLKFFVWKEMLQVIEPREVQLKLKGEESQTNLSVDRRSVLHRTDVQSQSAFPRQPRYTASRNLSQPEPQKNPPSWSFLKCFSTWYHGFATSANVFTSGQHYWEIEVGQIGQTGFWEVGIQDHILKYEGGNLSTGCPEGVTPLTLQSIPRKIGIYLDLPSQKLSFYNATNMAHIHTVSTKSSRATSMSAMLKMNYTTPNILPFTVCWY